jgi:hypothetical protein
MNYKKKAFIAIFISLFLFLPLYQGNAILSPSDVANYSSTNTSGEQQDKNLEMQNTYEIDGNTIRVEEIDEHNTQVYLNETYRVDIAQYEDHSQIDFYDISSGISAQKASLLVSILITTNETKTSFLITVGEKTIQLITYPDGAWVFYLEDITVTWSENDRTLILSYFEEWSITVSEGIIIINHLDYPLLTITQLEERQWQIQISETIVDATYVPEVSLYVTVDEGGGATEVFVEIPAEPAIGYTESVTISFIESVLIITYGEITVAIHPDKVVIDYIFIAVIVYIIQTTIIERIVIMVYEITIIFYVTIVELQIVIIYYELEIKIYITKITIIYYQLEITIIFQSIEIWYILIVWHFDIWVIEIEIWIQIFILIIQPVIFRFIPIFIFVPVPVIVPVYIPVFITRYVYIYVPQYPRLIDVDVAYEDLKMPLHTIDYNVTYIGGYPVNDANVTVEYNNTVYPTVFQSEGIYRAQLPASTTAEEIIVKAERPWYPDAILNYTIEVDWEITTTTTTTQQTPLPLIAIILGLFTTAAIGVVFKKKKEIFQ